MDHPVRQTYFSNDGETLQETLGYSSQAMTGQAISAWCCLWEMTEVCSKPGDSDLQQKTS